MKKCIILTLLVLLSFTVCKKKEKFPEPAYVMSKWTRAIQELNYRLYLQTEAYPKSETIFRDMYHDYYFTDMMVLSVEDPDPRDSRRDHEGNSYIHTSITFEGSVVKRSTGKPFRVIRGDAVFIKFVDGKRKNQGWLLSNRTFIAVDR